MSKPYYEEYTNHAMRFYARNPALKMSAPGLKKIDVENWVACDDAIRMFPEDDRATLIEIYRMRTGIPEAVKYIASENCVETNSIWQLLNAFSREFAKRRGLV